MYKAVRDGKKCAWCGHPEKDNFPLIPLGAVDPVWVHYLKCSDSYIAARRAQATEEDKENRPYLYPKSRWK